ncbi:MAG: AI-2E family transporter [Gammaproteobacteria bacterium]
MAQFLSDDQDKRRIIELTIQIGTIFVLVLWCFRIIEPFVLIVMWGVILAIALEPVFNKLVSLLGERHKLAATLMVLVLISILVVPAILLTDSLLNGAQTLVDASESGELQVPPPPPAVAEWPVIGEQAFDLWQKAATNLPAVLQEFSSQIKAIGAWILNTVTGTGLGILQFIVSFIISGAILTNYMKGRAHTRSLVSRLAPRQGEEFADIMVTTIRNVALGIVGISILQTALLSAGFLVIGLPGAGLAALAVLVLCIIQVGPGLVSIIAILYAFSAMDTLPASLFTVYAILATMCDSVLKPLVFGRGSSVPMLVIFLGAIGGMVAYGIIGLFVGAVVLALGFKLYMAWLDDAPEKPSAETTPE